MFIAAFQIAYFRYYIKTQYPYCLLIFTCRVMSQYFSFYLYFYYENLLEKVNTEIAMSTFYVTNHQESKTQTTSNLGSSS